MKKLFILLFSVELILTAVYAIAPLDIEILGVHTFLVLNDLCSFLRLTLIVAWIVFPPIVIIFPVLCFLWYKSGQHPQKSGTYWWKLIISGVLLLASLVRFTWFTILALMSV